MAALRMLDRAWISSPECHHVCILTLQLREQTDAWSRKYTILPGLLYAFLRPELFLAFEPRLVPHIIEFTHQVVARSGRLLDFDLRPFGLSEKSVDGDVLITGLT